MKNWIISVSSVLISISFSIMAQAGGGSNPVPGVIQVAPDAYCKGKIISFKSFKLIKAPYLFLVNGQVGSKKINETVSISFDPDYGVNVIEPYDINTGEYSREWQLFENKYNSGIYSFGIEVAHKNELEIIDNSVACHGLN